MKKIYLLFAAILIAVGLIAATASPASAVVVDPEAICHAKYSWADDHFYDPATQKCYWKNGSGKVNSCWPAYDILVWDPILGDYVPAGCGNSPSSGSSRTLTLKYLFSSGIFKFPGAGKFSPSPSTCNGLCKVKSGLKAPASSHKGSLPGKFKSGVYVQILDQNGDPTEGSFKICLPTKGAKNPKIYKYIGNGNWRLVGGGLTADGKKICTWADSSGNYAVANLP
ncbi:MAG: hypothetical protein PVF83_09715 [Anaerolineales bacterium]|jgi:hypothetical protein